VRDFAKYIKNETLDLKKENIGRRLINSENFIGNKRKNFHEAHEFQISENLR